METLKLQEYLRTHNGDFRELVDNMNINVRRHGKFPNLVLFKYGQESDLSLPIVQECRGIILDEKENWKVVALPYKKFFNAHEGFAAQIDWQTARVYEKLDGSCCTLYWNKYIDNGIGTFTKGDWDVATLGSPDASGNVHNNSEKTFSELFWETFRKLPHWVSILNALHINGCYVFELMTPENRVVIQHTDYRLVLHGVRCLTTLKELNPSLFSWAFPVVKQVSLSNNLDSIIKSADELNPMENEGYVIVDDNWNRIKVKNPRHVAIAHLKEDNSDIKFLRLIQKHEETEFLSYFPDYTGRIEQLKIDYVMMIREIVEAYSAYTGPNIQKDFALYATKFPFSSVMFTLRKLGANTSITEILTQLSDLQLERLFEGTMVYIDQIRERQLFD